MHDDKQAIKRLLYGLILLCLTLRGRAAFADQVFGLHNLPESVEATFQGNHGDTSIDFKISNNSDSPVTVKLESGTGFFKNSGGYQDMVTGESKAITVPPNAIRSGSIGGFCINKGIPAPGPGVGKLTPSTGVSSIPVVTQERITAFLVETDQFEKKSKDISLPVYFKQAVIHLIVLRTDLKLELARTFPYLTTSSLNQIESELISAVRSSRAKDHRTFISSAVDDFKRHSKRIAEKAFSEPVERQKFYSLWKRHYRGILWDLAKISQEVNYATLKAFAGKVIHDALNGLADGPGPRRYTTRAGHEVDLAQEVWDQIVLKNPTIRLYEGNIRDTLSGPDHVVTVPDKQNRIVFSSVAGLSDRPDPTFYTIDRYGAVVPEPIPVRANEDPETSSGQYFKWFPGLLGGKYFSVRVQGGRLISASIGDLLVLRDQADRPRRDGGDDEPPPPPPNGGGGPPPPDRRDPFAGGDIDDASDSDKGPDVDDKWPTANIGLAFTVDGYDDRSSARQKVQKGADPVILRTGEFVLTETDLRIPGRGFDFVMQRTYRSQYRLNGPMGQNWDFNYNQRLILPGSANDDLRVVRRKGFGRIDAYVRNDDGSFTSPAGFYDQLHKNEDGTFTIRDRYGFKTHFDARGHLTGMADRNGNVMNFAYDSRGCMTTVTDTLGRQIRFSYSQRGRIIAVTDFFGRRVRYAYDQFGDLVAVRSPIVVATSIRNDFPSGKIIRYQYTSGSGQSHLDHNLITVIDPKGQRYLVNEYGTDPNSYAFDRVIKQYVGGPDQLYKLCYRQLNAGEQPITPDLQRNETVVVDRNGHSATFIHNQMGNVLVERVGGACEQDSDPSDPIETTHTYNRHGERTSSTFPEGNRIEYTFDDSNPDRLQQGNLIAVMHLPGRRRGDQKQIRVTYEYEPIFNQIRSVTDPRGLDPHYRPQNSGAASARRYTTTFQFDYQEGDQIIALAKAMNRHPDQVTTLLDKAGIEMGLGDLNQDGHADQVGGNIIRRIAPAVDLPEGSSQADLDKPAKQQVVSAYTYNRFGQLTSETDPEGHIETYFYHPENDPDGDGVTTVTPRLLSAVTGGYRRAVAYRSGPSSPAVTIRNSWLYDAVGNVVQFVDGRGHPTVYERNALNQVVRIVAPPPFNDRHRFYYDENNNVVREEIRSAEAGHRDPTERARTTYEYDVLDNLIARKEKVSEEQTLVTRYDYDNSENLIKITQPEGNSVERVYNERGFVSQIIRGAGTQVPAVHTLTYDRNGNLVQIVDAADNTADGANEQTRLFYDGFDRPVRIVDAVGNQSVANYDPAGNRVRERRFEPVQRRQEPSGVVGDDRVRLAERYRLFDELNREFKRQDLLFSGVVPAGKKTSAAASDTRVTTQFEYDRNSRLVRVIDDNGHQRRFEYDEVDRIVREIDELRNEVRYGYDDNHNLIETTQIDRSPQKTVPEEHFTTKRQYDELNRVTAVIDSLGNQISYTYDSRNNVIKKVDRLGNTTRYIYDRIDRLLAEKVDLRRGGLGSGAIDTSNPANTDGQIVTSYVWDRNSRLTAVTDDNGNTTRYAYDALNRRVAEIFADKTTNQYVYDGDDNVVKFTDQNGSVHRHDFDGLNRLIQKSVDRASGIEGSTRWQFEYDGLSRLTHATDNNDPLDDSDDHDVTFQYDSLSRLLVETQNGRQVRSTYDGVRNRQTLTYPNGRVMRMTYDGLDRIDGIHDRKRVVAQYDYLGPGRVLERRYGNGTRLAYHNGAGKNTGYDNLQRRVRHRHTTKDGTLVAGFGHAFDQENNRRYEVDQFASITDVFEYDSAYRLTRVTRQVPINAVKGIKNNTATKAKIEAINGLSQTTYQFDGVGNWLRRTQDGLDTTFTPTPMNAYRSVGRVAQEHDANGNLTRDGPRRYIYDFANRLVRVTDNEGQDIACYAYDALGRRVIKTTSQRTVHYLYDGVRAIEERDRQGDLLCQYVFGSGIDEVLELRTDGHSYFYHDNWLGSIVALTDETGGVVERYRYDEYGKTTVFNPDRTVALAHSQIGNPYRFTGRRFDHETGNYHYRARSYDPARGRFLQRDPKGYIDGMGLYTYVGNNPLNWLDPFGLEKKGFWSRVWDRVTGSGLLTRVGGALQAIGGIGEATLGVTFGVATSWTGFGAVAGGTVAVHGVDQAIAGFRTLFTGEYHRSFTSQGLQAAGLSETAAEIIDASISIGGTAGLGMALKSSSLLSKGSLHRGVLSKFSDGIPKTGISSLDAPAISSGSFSQKMNAIRRLGYEVIEDTNLAARGEFDVIKKTFTFNPNTMTRLDLAHEWRHYRQLRQFQTRGLSYKTKLNPLAEIGAYRYEQRLWQRIGKKPVLEYLKWHSNRLQGYQSYTRNIDKFLRYKPRYRGIRY